MELGDIEHVMQNNETRNVVARSTAGANATASKIAVTVQGNFTNKVGEAVVELQSTGANGANGDGAATNKNGKPGGTGGSGGEIRLVVGPNGGTTQLAGTAGKPVINLESVGGSGGNGSNGSSAGLDSVQTSGASGGFGGAGGAILILTNGTTTINAASEAISMNSTGGSGGSGGEAEKNNSIDGQGGGGSGRNGGNGGDIYLDRDSSGTDSTGSWEIITRATGTAIAISSRGGNGGGSGKTERADGKAGGAGGSAGSIAVGDADRTITLQGIGSTAVEITGIGGNGGSGSSARSDATGKPGDGGAGGRGSDVALNGAWAISAETSGSKGIVANSTGGNGGHAGYSSFTARGGGVGGAGGDMSVVIQRDSTIASDGEALAIGSTGGHGGQGGNVNRDPSGNGGKGGAGGKILLDRDATGAVSAGNWNISTTGASSAAVLLQSIGGTGGNGGSETSASTVSADGGLGGDGGVGGDISIEARARTLTITGSNARGLVARSEGGLGGEGGQGRLSGGEGGGGGLAGSITLDANAEAGTEEGWDVTVSGGGNATGIVLQTIGGAGGKSGQSSTTSGRTAGAGGKGGGITTRVGVERRFTLSGAGSRAVVLETIGGKGGEGGQAIAGISSKDASDGGRGGDAGHLYVNGTWTIVTNGGTTSGLYLYNTGGEGGAGGFVPSGALDNGGVGGAGGSAGPTYVSTQADSTITVAGGSAISVQTRGGEGGKGGEGGSYGGTGGGGGRGGNITFDQDQLGGLSTGTWNLTTTGDKATALVLTSTGGKGAIGGEGRGTRGGAGGNGGVGGNIKLAQGTRVITTSGDTAHGAAISSYGGFGADASRDFLVGAGGYGGDAGTIDIAGEFMVSTSGSGAHALRVRSVGGMAGYGEGKNKPNNRGGDGGTITLTNSLNATTKGPGSYGASIVSQGGIGSYGKGNGNSGRGGSISVDSALVIQTGGYKAIGFYVASLGNVGIYQRTNGSDGGPVAAVSEASISTLGDYAVGFLAQSVGGTGTYAPDGSGGSVEVTLTGGGLGISTAGKAAHGLGAFSLSGSLTKGGNASTVSVTTDTDVIATGPGAHGIYAQSVGKSAGTITLNVGANATVIGGVQSGTTNLPDGSAIRIVGGSKTNTLTNYGTITYTAGPNQSRNAFVQAGSGYTSIENFGTLTGNVNRSQDDISALGAASPGIADEAAPGIRLINHVGGTLNAGPRIETNRLGNHGLLSPGGEGAEIVTAIAGNFVQTRTGTLTIEVSGKGDHDQVNVAGTASLNGGVEVELTDLDAPLIGRQSRTILIADDGVTVSESLSLTESVVAGFELLDSTNDRVRLGFEVDFASGDATAALNRNQVNLANHLQDLYKAGLLDVDLAEGLISLETANDYAEVLNNLSAEVALDNQISAVQAFQGFQEQLLSCADTSGTGAVRFLDDGTCVFATAGGAGFERDATSDSLGYSGTAWSVSGGAQVALGEEWTIGGALGYTWQQTSVSGTSASSDGHSIFAGVSAKRHFGALEFAVSSSLGYGDYDIDRQPVPGVDVNADQNFWSLGGRVRAAYVFGSEKAFIKPRVDLGVDHVFGSSFSESGATGTRLLIDTDDQTDVSLAPAVEFGTELVAFDGLRFRPNVTVGLTQYLNSPSASLTAKFADAGGVVDGFDARTDIARTFFDLSGGIDFFAKEHAVLRAGAFTRLSSDDTIYGGSLRVEVPF